MPRIHFSAIIPWVRLFAAYRPLRATRGCGNLSKSRCEANLDAQSRRGDRTGGCQLPRLLVTDDQHRLNNEPVLHSALPALGIRDGVNDPINPQL